MEDKNLSVLWDFGRVWCFWCDICNKPVGDWHESCELHPDKAKLPEHHCNYKAG